MQPMQTGDTLRPQVSDKEDKLRADARINRDRILDVARDTLAAHPDASRNFTAKAADVVAGKMYSHSPNREALLIGVYRKEINALVALASALLKEHSPLEALRVRCNRFV